MSMQSLFEKLQLKDEKNLLIQGLPSSIEKQFVKLSYSKNVTPLLKIKKIDFALVFSISSNQLWGILREVFPALHIQSKLWIAFPRTTSKIASDLNRDCSWQTLANQGFEGTGEVELDHVWTAMQFKKLEKIAITSSFADFSNCEMKTNVDFNKSLIVTPKELENHFMKHKKAKEFFSSLSFTNQKEYVSWIEGAKRIDTKQRRVEATLEKLLAGKKNPSEK
jgi:hypothetical protein